MWRLHCVVGLGHDLESAPAGQVEEQRIGHELSVHS
jgi:hypothetical protein